MISGFKICGLQNAFARQIIQLLLLLNVQAEIVFSAKEGGENEINLL